MSLPNIWKSLDFFGGFLIRQALSHARRGTYNHLWVVSLLRPPQFAFIVLSISFDCASATGYFYHFEEALDLAQNLKCCIQDAKRQFPT